MESFNQQMEALECQKKELLKQQMEDKFDVVKEQLLKKDYKKHLENKIFEKHIGVWVKQTYRNRNKCYHYNQSELYPQLQYHQLH